MTVMIGVDIGTTSTKVVAFDLHGHAQASANNSYPLCQSEPDMAEESPEEIFTAVITGLKQVVAQVAGHSIAGISFSAAMHSVIVMDADDQPLTQVLTWADNRGAAFAQQLRADGRGAALFARTGVPVHPMSPLVKLMWLQQAQPAVMAQAAHVIGIKDYVLFRMFGRYVQDYSLANATGLMNIFTMDWDPTALALAGVTAAQLPQLVDTDHQLKQMRPEIAQLIGIAADTPVVIGASDGVLSNLGVAAITPGTVAVTIGTSGAVRTVVDHPVCDPNGRLFTYYLAPGRWVIGGPVNNGGVVWRWARDAFFADRDYDQLTALAAKVPAGADGLLFLPYLGGERAPLWDADARGSFIGLTRQHDRATMLKAVLEGITFNLFAVMQLVAALAGQPKAIQATGGFARSGLWRQLLADVFAAPVTIPDSFESSALGAAVLGMQALGLCPSLDAVVDMVGQTHTQQPSDDAAVYAELMPVWTDCADRLAGAYAAIAGFQRRHPNANAAVAAQD
ncbi:gluconokinase [Lacticaseibacillus baoqingensis]|uniref:Gluconokinase n=1 Tax=Lacticaseibacillus baoqingensis TaxID=2486013 RepID=A0ABW4E6T3_9LACO|nr:FGGY family carbohydrate kinase [Lacticaseibacillus baoqingensis]